MTQKRIAITVEIPDGATHYRLDKNRLLWYKLSSSVWSWWDGVAGIWRKFLDDDFTEETIEIEVIQ